ncbi:homeobox protein XHOX-7.1-like [Physella acuta]|uniref:homeobox protein XHOX-7.1-like n=1 Tax=Physella acuta TaxID=109671 RepID=UPI0027DDC91C|nr:homeobox protein XHOX-7.1-like [Physella acuta]
MISHSYSSFDIKPSSANDTPDRAQSVSLDTFNLKYARTEPTSPTVRMMSDFRGIEPGPFYHATLQRYCRPTDLSNSTNNARVGFEPEPPARKPELKFSIERILGLRSEDETQDLNQTKPNPFDDSRLVADEVGDEYNSGEDVDEDESIDVDDTSVSDNFHHEQYDGEYVKNEDDTLKYQWLHCTRYHPPKLQRTKKKEGAKKRKLCRNPRVPFTQHQVVVLEDKFRRTHYLSSIDVAELSSALSLTETRVKIWFQNRRARERRDKGGSHKNHEALAHKTFQPLTVPSVSWPVGQTMAANNYVQYHNALDFRSSYLPPGFGIYNPGHVAKEVMGQAVDESDLSRLTSMLNNPDKSVHF